MGFVHLHNHTQYSMLDGACRVDRMVKLAKEYGMPAVAMTDHGNMFGTIDFVTTCQKAGIKPIVGTEAYVIPGEFEDVDSKKQKRHHLVLLAKDITGYRNLCKLSSFSYQKGFYYKPRMTKSMLRKHSEGIICTTACIQGEVPSLLLQNRKEDAKKTLLELKDIFGEDLYVELQDHGIDKEKEVMPKLIELARETNTEMIVTNDCHYLKDSDSEAHDILLCIQTNHYETDPDRMRYGTDQLYFKTEEEMRKLFPDIPEAYENTLKIADKVDLKLEYDKFLFPDFEVPKDYSDSEEYLKALCYNAIPKRYAEITPEIQKRLDYELNIINKMGFNEYFLIVRDFINASREAGIPVGPGRGSAAGSIVAYLLEITQLDPLKYDLLFERFLNLNRAEMPDIDIDFDSEGRERVIDYVIGKYGRESICQIVTFGTMGTKTVIRDVGRVLQIPISEVNKLAKLVPDAPKMTLEKAYNMSGDLHRLIDENPTYQRVYRIGQVLEGLIRQTGIHAAGVVMGPGDLSNFVPLAIATQKSNAGTTLVQYEGKWLDHLKMLKMDFLGLKTLTLIRKTMVQIKQNYDIDIDIDNLPLDDKKVYELLANAETDGVFQLESSGMKKYLRKLKPNQFDDIIAMVALYRPGPMQYIDKYIARKHGEEAISYRHPIMEKALKSTYGITVYQEQVMQISKDLAGFDSASAGVLRKAISKKKEKMMAEMYTKFEEGSQKNGVELQTIQQIWEDFKEFAQYAFNKSHAACYAFISYQTAYLKAHYPVEFMAALMSEEKDPAKIPYQINVCKKMGIEVIPPDVNLSLEEFSVQGKKILYGLKGVKNVGGSAIKKLLEERTQNGKFEDLWNFASRNDSSAVNKAVMESLIMAGAMDCFEGNRAQKFDAIQKAIEYSSSIFEEKRRGQMTLFDDFAEDDEMHMTPELNNIKEWPFSEVLQKEKEVLGFFWSGHPLDKHKNLIESVSNVESNIVQRKNASPPQNVIIAGVVNAVNKKRTKRGNQFAIVEMEDLKGKYEICLFGDKYDQLASRFVAGKEFLIKGRNNYQGDGLFSVLPDCIYDLNEFSQNCSGELTIEISQEALSDDLCEYLVGLSAPENRVSLNIVLKTNDFKTLNCQSALKLAVNDEILMKLKDVSENKPVLKIN